MRIEDGGRRIEGEAERSCGHDSVLDPHAFY
jgi:hypothetical protein